MARITWQNVAAPDFSDASAAMARSGDAFERAMAVMGGVAGSLGERRRNEASTAAMAEAMRIRDTGGWDAAMSGGILQQLGLAPNQVNPELMNWLDGNRGTLEGAAQADANLDQTNMDITRTGLLNQETAQTMDHRGQNQNRQQTLWGRDDTAYGRSEAEWGRGEDARLRDLAMVDWVDQALGRDDVDLSTPAEFDSLIENSNLSPQEKESARRAAADRVPGYFATPENVEMTPRLSEATRVTQQMMDHLTLQETREQREIGSNSVYNTLFRAEEAYGANASTADVSSTLISEYRQPGDSSDGDDQRPILDESAADINRAVRKYSDEFGLPPSVVGMVLSDTLRRNRVGGLGRLAFDHGAIRSQLETMANSDDMAAFDQTRQGYEASARQRESARNKLMTLNQSLVLAEERGESARADRIMEEIQQIQQGLLTPAEETPAAAPAGSPPPAPAPTPTPAAAPAAASIVPNPRSPEAAAAADAWSGMIPGLDALNDLSLNMGQSMTDSWSGRGRLETAPLRTDLFGGPSISAADLDWQAPSRSAPPPASVAPGSASPQGEAGPASDPETLRVADSYSGDAIAEVETAVVQVESGVNVTSDNIEKISAAYDNLAARRSTLSAEEKRLFDRLTTMVENLRNSQDG